MSVKIQLFCKLQNNLFWGITTVGDEIIGNASGNLAKVHLIPCVHHRLIEFVA